MTNPPYSFKEGSDRDVRRAPTVELAMLAVATRELRALVAS